MPQSQFRRRRAVPERALRDARRQRERRRANLEAQGVPSALIEKVLGPANCHIERLTRIVTKERLDMARRRRAVAPRRVRIGCHRRASGARGVRQRGSRRATTSPSSSRGDPDESEPAEGWHLGRAAS